MPVRIRLGSQDMLDLAKHYTITNINEAMERLQNYCDRDPEVERLVHYIVSIIKNQDLKLNKEFDYDTYMGYELAGFIVALDEGYNNSKALNYLDNPFHFQANWIYDLNRFIGFFIMDDGSFSFRPTGRWDAWEIIDRTSEYADEDSWPEEWRSLHCLSDMLKFADENVKLHLQNPILKSVKKARDD